MTSKQDKPRQNKPEERAGELARDQQRADEGGPRYGGEGWDVAAERGDQRFGHARNDDADPSEAVKRDPDVAHADGTVEAAPEQAGMGRGEKPRKPRFREKNRR